MANQNRRLLRRAPGRSTGELVGKIVFEIVQAEVTRRLAFAAGQTGPVLGKFASHRVESLCLKSLRQRPQMLRVREHPGDQKAKRTHVEIQVVPIQSDSVQDDTMPRSFKSGP